MAFWKTYGMTHSKRGTMSARHASTWAAAPSAASKASPRICIHASQARRPSGRGISTTRAPVRLASSDAASRPYGSDRIVAASAARPSSA